MKHETGENKLSSALEIESNENFNFLSYIMEN